MVSNLVLYRIYKACVQAVSDEYEQGFSDKIS